jgi:hypothetical protein
MKPFSLAPPIDDGEVENVLVGIVALDIRHHLIHVGFGGRSHSFGSVAIRRDFILAWSVCARSQWIRSSWPSCEWSPKLWCGRTTHPKVLETARDASKATAEVACGRGSASTGCREPSVPARVPGP